MKKYIYFVLLSFNSILALAFILFAGIIRTYIDIYLPLGTLLVFFWLIVFVFLSELILLIIGMIYFVHIKKYCFVCIVLLAALLIIPTTKYFGIINYKIYYSLRKEFVETLDEKIQNYPQIGTDEYFIKDVRLSYTGSVMIDVTDDGATKVMFDIGLGSSYVLIYSSDKSGVSDGDFSYGFNDKLRPKFKIIEKLDDYWCIAAFE